MKFRFKMIFIALTVAAVGAMAGRAAQAETMFGEALKLGEGTVKSYAMVGDEGRPTAIGVVFTQSALEGLPPTPNRTGRCFDLDGNGRINDEGECEGDYEFRMSLPAVLAEREDMPFRWVGVNWNVHGHPPAAWSVPHFDFHFYMVERAAIDSIRVGPCPFFINCEDKKRALVKVPAKYVHADHIDVEATVSMMGNHLIDSKTPELAERNRKPFTHTWIFGAYEGRITFYETMITRDYLLSRPANGCHPIKQPKAWERAGYYPTVYCIRHSREHGTYTVSLEGMVYRQAE